ncbi:Endonuclease/exonuclease/phosphatase [Dillenia turbinata]|uniref:Endonuclease/exonuclease/phosphatase n=1 Tax=Dillenia turbinata TaxID=194707 RepID=A0AAN8ZCN8_9MAGN
MLKILSKKLRCLCSRLWWSIWRRSKPKVVFRRLKKIKSKSKSESEPCIKKSATPLYGQIAFSMVDRPIRIATFNAAMFSMAPAVPKAETNWLRSPAQMSFETKSLNYHPKSILKHSPLHPTMESPKSPENFSKQSSSLRSNLKVSINLPENEISLAHRKSLRNAEDKTDDSPKAICTINRSNVPVRSPICFPFNSTISWQYDEPFQSGRSIVEVLREVDADILALQDVKAVEEKGMKPLSDLALALGMYYVFAESWAPEYGNAILSKWPIKRWKAQKICDDDDFRNVLRATIDVPWIGEMNFHCTQLDHLDENWRMKQINAIIQSNNTPHILAGGLNSLDDSDYSSERWVDIVKYYDEKGKPKPAMEVMKFLKGKKYIDAKDFAGECESVVIIAKGQNVQGTCKYGTRVDYILASQDMPCKFVPSSYSVISSKGTSDHHIVKVDVVRVKDTNGGKKVRRQQPRKQKPIRIGNHCSSRGIRWMNF